MTKAQLYQRYVRGCEVVGISEEAILTFEQFCGKY
jgi:hypothetical protein